MIQKLKHFLLFSTSCVAVLGATKTHSDLSPDPEECQKIIGQLKPASIQFYSHKNPNQVHTFETLTNINDCSIFSAQDQKYQLVIKNSSPSLADLILDIQFLIQNNSVNNAKCSLSYYVQWPQQVENHIPKNDFNYTPENWDNLKKNQFQIQLIPQINMIGGSENFTFIISNIQPKTLNVLFDKDTFLKEFQETKILNNNMITFKLPYKINDKGVLNGHLVYTSDFSYQLKIPQEIQEKLAPDKRTIYYNKNTGEFKTSIHYEKIDSQSLALKDPFIAVLNEVEKMTLFDSKTNQKAKEEKFDLITTRHDKVYEDAVIILPNGDLDNYENKGIEANVSQSDLSPINEKTFIRNNGQDGNVKFYVPVKICEEMKNSSLNQSLSHSIYIRSPLYFPTADVMELLGDSNTPGCLIKSLPLKEEDKVEMWQYFSSNSVTSKNIPTLRIQNKTLIPILDLGKNSDQMWKKLSAENFIHKNFTKFSQGKTKWNLIDYTLQNNRWFQKLTVKLDCITPDMYQKLKAWAEYKEILFHVISFQQENDNAPLNEKIVLSKWIDAKPQGMTIKELENNLFNKYVDRQKFATISGIFNISEKYGMDLNGPIFSTMGDFLAAGHQSVSKLQCEEGWEDLLKCKMSFDPWWKDIADAINNKGKEIDKSVFILGPLDYVRCLQSFDGYGDLSYISSLNNLYAWFFYENAFFFGFDFNDALKDKLITKLYLSPKITHSNLALIGKGTLSLLLLFKAKDKISEKNYKMGAFCVAGSSAAAYWTYDACDIYKTFPLLNETLHSRLKKIDPADKV